MNEPKLIESKKTGEIGRKLCDHGEMNWRAEQLRVQLLS
jgi:hypothetical protein